MLHNGHGHTLQKQYDASDSSCQGLYQERGMWSTISIALQACRRWVTRGPSVRSNSTTPDASERALEVFDFLTLAVTFMNEPPICNRMPGWDRTVMARGLRGDFEVQHLDGTYGGAQSGRTNGYTIKGAVDGPTTGRRLIRCHEVLHSFVVVGRLTIWAENGDTLKRSETLDLVALVF
jgi:hypothetical protein